MIHAPRSRLDFTETSPLLHETRLSIDHGDVGNRMDLADQVPIRPSTRDHGLVHKLTLGSYE